MNRDRSWEGFQRLQAVATMLNDIGPQLERINPGAAETAFRIQERINGRLERWARQIATEEVSRIS